jgi:hypothetical protein
MPHPSTDDLVKAATKEWEHWGKSTWNCITGKKSSGFHIDDELKFAQYVVDTYLPPFFKKPIKWPTLTAISEDDYPWSAVTISHFYLRAGFARTVLPSSSATAAEYNAWVASSTAGEFPISQSHSDYIRWSIRARKDNVQSATYWGYRIDEAEAVPEVGDLVGYPRATGMTTKKALGFFDKTGGYNSHTDLVVAKRQGEIDVIGGNVRDSVTLKTLATNANGRVIDNQHFWFVVMKRR